jgi:hypothetical protein
VTTGDYLTVMKVIGIKQLKAKLSEKPVVDRPEELLEGLAASDEITRAAQAKGEWTWRSRGLGMPASAAQRLLDELRQERP